MVADQDEPEPGAPHLAGQVRCRKILRVGHRDADVGVRRGEGVSVASRPVAIRNAVPATACAPAASITLPRLKADDTRLAMRRRRPATARPRRRPCTQVPHPDQSIKVAVRYQALAEPGPRPPWALPAAPGQLGRIQDRSIGAHPPTQPAIGYQRLAMEERPQRPPMIAVPDVGRDVRVDPAGEPTYVVREKPKAVDGVAGPARNEPEDALVIELGSGPEGVMVPDAIANIPDPLEQVHDPPPKSLVSVRRG